MFRNVPFEIYRNINKNIGHTILFWITSLFAINMIPKFFLYKN